MPCKQSNQTKFSSDNVKVFIKLWEPFFFIFIGLNLYNYWNSTDAKFEFSNNGTKGSNLSPSTQAYSVVTFWQLLPLFMTFLIIYGLLLFFIKYFISPDFKFSTHKEQLKQILKLFIIPEVNGDCQTMEQWKLEMLLLSLMQIASDLILLVPFFVTGKKH